MRRRQFITLIGGAALAAPRLARAQQRVRRIGVLMGYAENDPEGQALVSVFRAEFQKLGWNEGKNVRFDYAWTGTNVESLQRGARELIAARPDLIVSSGTPGTTALLQQTRTIPIIFAVVVDPVGSGFVASLAQPGGNATGFMNLDPRMAGKWVELLKEIAPSVTRVVIPYNPSTETYADIYLPHFRSAATNLGMTVEVAVVRSTAELAALIAAQARVPNTGLIPMPGAFMVGNRATVISLTTQHKIPAVYFNRSYMLSGGLMSYGIDNRDNYRRAASYVDRILKGEKPGDLPVQFPVKFELLINLKTARRSASRCRCSSSSAPTR
jgi:putative tryptophan/tyrosine transport system substrate-binding protein